MGSWLAHACLVKGSPGDAVTLFAFQLVVAMQKGGPSAGACFGFRKKSEMQSAPYVKKFPYGLTSLQDILHRDNKL